VNEKSAPVYFIYTTSLQPGNRRLRPLVQSCPLVSQFEYTPRGVKSMLLHIESLLRHLFPLGANVTSSMKQEIHNISQRNASCAPENDRAANINRKLLKIGYVIPEIRSRTHIQRNRQTDRQTWSSQYSAPSAGAE